MSAKKSKGEVLVFRRGHTPPDLYTGKTVQGDSESSIKDEKKGVSEAKGGAAALDGGDVNLQRQTAIIHWQDVCYDIKIKNEERRILDHVDGSVYKISQPR